MIRENEARVSCTSFPFNALTRLERSPATCAAISSRERLVLHVLRGEVARLDYCGHGVLGELGKIRSCKTLHVGIRVLLRLVEKLKELVLVRQVELHVLEKKLDSEARGSCSRWLPWITLRSSMVTFFCCTGSESLSEMALRYSLDLLMESLLKAIKSASIF